MIIQSVNVVNLRIIHALSLDVCALVNFFKLLYTINEKGAIAIKKMWSVVNPISCMLRFIMINANNKVADSVVVIAPYIPIFCAYLV